MLALGPASVIKDERPCNLRTFPQSAMRVLSGRYSVGGPFFGRTVRDLLETLADTSIGGRRVARELDAIISWRGKLRDELLNETLFSSLADARANLEAWRRDFNEVRPHSSLGYVTPADYACALSGKTGRRAANPDHSARRPLASGDHEGSNQPGLSLWLDENRGGRSGGRRRRTETARQRFEY